MNAQAMAQSPFFYYNPEQNADHRQQAMFSPHPSAVVPSSHLHQLQHIYATDRPAAGYLPSYPSYAFQTPVASPRPIYQKAYTADGRPLVLNTECNIDGMSMYPATPALSMSGSAVSSPPTSCGVLPTPTGGTFFGGNLTGVKEGCEGEVNSEILAGENWARKGSPPLTPVFLHPPSVVASQASDILADSCPSLSPSPSPIPKSAVSETDFDFCDPRNILVRSPESFELPAEPTLHESVFGSHPGMKPEAHFMGTDMLNLPVFDSFSDLESENDFVTKISPTDNVHYFGSKRQRLDLSFDEDFLSEGTFEDVDDMDPFAAGTAAAEIDESETASKKARKNSKKVTVTVEPPTDGTASCCDDATVESTLPSSAASPDASVLDAPTPTVQPVARRGRKQSLTEDPSKQFKCELCNRRFRRQEHLKRHYRSLHTTDKPFACEDCGKKFSRSDNLAQHQRTHGSGAVVMGVYEEGEYPLDGEAKPADLGTLLLEATAAISSSESDSDAPSNKRKRDE